MRVLIATATAGGGHLAAAAALEEAWNLQRPADEVIRWDVLDFFSPLHRKLYANGYIQLAERAPELWGLMFKTTDDPALSRRIRKLRRLFSGQSRSRFERQLRKLEPDAVLCTHYLPLETLGRVRTATPESRRLPPGKPFVASVVTDFEAHALWMDGCVDLYFVANEATGTRLKARGIKPDSILATGIPIGPKFAQPVESSSVCRKLGLREDSPVLLVLSGGFGMGPVAEILGELDKTEAEFQILVVTGRNEELRKELAAQDRRHPTHVLGFAGNMHELMAVSSLIITKPGGLTTSEALAAGRPLLVVNPIPGQEAANSDFLLERGAAVKINRVEDLPYRVAALLTGNQLQRMAKAAKKLGRPDAAARVCDEVSRRVPA